ncbi:MAG: BatA and WFA domain-containing protein, partial [Planctomycetota bacterium]|nr:BatA and WFA domain-containing protein [Planctomycetota bacterium]
MSLLAPGDAFLAFIAGGLVLLVLYILKLRRRPLRVSSIIHWNPAAADAQANEPFQRLRPSWLLLLHLIILLLLSLAAGQPVWKSSDDAAAARTILILDTSASMNAVDSPASPSRFEQALSRAGKLVDTATSGGTRSVAIISAAAEPSLVSGFTSASSLAKSALSNIAPTDQPGNLQAAMQLAQAIASTSSEQDETASTRIVLLTDSVEPATAPGTLVISSSLPVSIERIGQNEAGIQPLNRGITRLSARRDGPGSATLRIFVQVSSNRPAAAGTDQIPLAVTLQGRTVAQRVLEVNLSKGLDDRTATTTFELPQVGLGLLEVAITQPDALSADNTAAMFIDPPLNPSLILVQRPTGTIAVPAAGLLLSDVISELPLRKLTRMTPQEFDTTAAQGGLGDADLVLFDHASPFKAPSLPTIAFGTTLTTAGIERKDVPSPPTSLFWQRTHPLLSSISLESLVIDDPYVLAITPTTGVTVEELLTCREGPVMVSMTGGGPR